MLIKEPPNRVFSSSYALDEFQFQVDEFLHVHQTVIAAIRHQHGVGEIKLMVDHALHNSQIELLIVSRAFAFVGIADISRLVIHP